MTEESVVELANYLKRLETLNENYKAQISTLEGIVTNLKEQIATLEKKLTELKKENDQLRSEISISRAKETVWKVIAAIAIGGVIYLFVTSQ